MYVAEQDAGADGRAGTRPSRSGARGSAMGGMPVVTVSRQDGGSPYGRALVLAAGLEPAVWCPSRARFGTGCGTRTRGVVSVIKSDVQSPLCQASVEDVGASSES